MKTIITFGEIMGRLCPDDFQRFSQSMPGNMNLTFAGAEANVAASGAMLGGKAKFVTTLPKNDISDACVTMLRGLKIDVSGLNLVDYGRLGLYFVERGANQRPSRVIYDRDHSSVSMALRENSGTPEKVDRPWIGFDPVLLTVNGQSLLWNILLSLPFRISTRNGYNTSTKAHSQNFRISGPLAM